MRAHLPELSISRVAIEVLHVAKQAELDRIEGFHADGAVPPCGNGPFAGFQTQLSAMGYKYQFVTSRGSSSSISACSTLRADTATGHGGVFGASTGGI